MVAAHSVGIIEEENAFSNPEIALQQYPFERHLGF
jgi:hypothetical protein